MNFVVDRLRESELAEAARIVRHAFGTFIGVPDLDTFWTDRDYVHGRWRAPHVAAFAARSDDRLVGSNFAVRWGSVGYFGPLTVDPAFQGQGASHALLARTMDAFDAWGTHQVGLFTFAHSAKHVGLYQKYGFHARFLTAVMATPAVRRPSNAAWTRFSALAPAEREEALRACRDVAETLYPGLDLTDEIRTVTAEGLGDTVIVENAQGVAAFAIGHYGPRSEAGAGNCLIKFGAVRDTPTAGQDFLNLLDAAEALAADAGMPTLLVGMNLARIEAYRQLVARGFRTAIQGVAMHRGNEPGYCRPGIYVIDDWR